MKVACQCLHHVAVSLEVDRVPRRRYVDRMCVRRSAVGTNVELQIGHALRETQEMVFDAHDRAFAFYKGACRRGIYDNMKTAATNMVRRYGRCPRGSTLTIPQSRLPSRRRQ